MSFEISQSLRSVSDMGPLIDVAVADRYVFKRW